MNNSREGLSHRAFDWLSVHARGLKFSLSARGSKPPEQFTGEGTDVLIVGNGPSLDIQALKSLDKKGLEVCFVNFFPLKSPEIFKSIRPEYLCLVDPVFSDSTTHERAASLIKLLEDSVSWDMTVITSQYNPLHFSNPHIRTYVLSKRKLCYDGQSKGLKKYVFSRYRKNIATPGMQNVMIAACFYFVNKGARRVYLSGLDMSEFKGYTVDENNDIYLSAEHYYSKEKIRSDIPRGGFYRLMGAYALMFEEFHYINEYAACRQVEIINLTPCSFVDVFEKKNWVDVFNG